MRALTVRPGAADSLALLDLPEPRREDGPVLVESIEVGVCGTDTDIVRAAYGTAPPGSERLVLGHESLGRVLGDESGRYAPGELVVGIVRRPDPVPCPACAIDEWDMCVNGLYTEHGIVALDGFLRERWRVEPEALVRVEPVLADFAVLMEPASVVAKAWEQIERIGSRAYFGPRVVAVLGAGPIGLLSALLSVEKGFETHVFDVVTEGLKPTLVSDLGAIYHAEPLTKSGVSPEIVLECTGVSQVIIDALNNDAANGIVCLLGVSMVGALMSADIGALNRRSVLCNDVIFGSVNANRRHYELAAAALGTADPAWIRRLISRRVPMEDFDSAFDRRRHDVKVVLTVNR
jgi:glucose 1-dehydrogenase